MEQYQKLLARLAEISHIGSAAAVLGWDQQCYMPSGGARERAEQFAVLGKISHEMLVSDETRALLEGAEQETAGLAPESDERLTLRHVRRDFDHSVKLPTKLVQELAKAEAIGHEVWVEARETSNFKKFAPTLEHLLDLSRQKAEYLGTPAGGTLYDALLDQFEPGKTTAEVERVFNELRPGLVELVREIAAAPQLDDSVLKREYPEQGQKAFVDFLVAKLGFDFSRGRQDVAVHPFCTSFTRDDVRITTRFDKNWLPCAVMGSIHETGHALYEQGFDPKDDDTPLSTAAGLGIHESQSRLWENIVGRSRPFWKVYLPELKKHFKSTLKDVDLDTFYKAINRVEPSTIRVEADEVTYNLHIMLRFELEKELLAGKLAVKDVPTAWNEKMQEYLGIMPSDDKHGCLQDVHWSGGMFGYFPTYALGTLLSAQLYEQALKDEPGIEGELSRGEFGSLLNWLREKVHKPGARYLPSELVERVCGEPAQSRSYLSYLRGKFGQLYGLN